MENIITEKGLIKFNRNAFALCTGALVLMGAGLATGYIGGLEEPISHLAGGLLIGSSHITTTWSVEANEQLKKIK